MTTVNTGIGGRGKRPCVGLVSLGCSKNRVDSEQLLGMLTARGFEITADPESADAIIVNTCGFITDAKEESIDTIFEMAQYRISDEFPCSVLAVTGCLSGRYADELPDALPEVDIMWGVRDYERFADALGERFGMTKTCAHTTHRVLTTPSYSAYLRISDGCYNRCSYCAIPLIRGNLKSEPMPELIAEAQRLADSGVTELNIIAQDTSAYGLDLYHRMALPELLGKISDISALRIIRLLYAYPDTVTDELINVMTERDNIANYLDLPIQHINDRVLRDMHRRAKGDDIRRIITKLRKIPGMILRTSLIVGFPGETDAEFTELLDFLSEYPIDRVGAFRYSPEEGTPAAEMPNQVAEETKQARYDTLMSLQAGISRSLSERRIGSEVNMLTEGYRTPGVVVGRSYGEAPEVDGKLLVSAAAADAPKPGEYRRVLITGTHGEYDMEGKLI